MKRLKDYGRTRRIILDTITSLQLNLAGMVVLTEAASGNYAVTPVIALLSGADRVYVVCKDTGYGSIKEVLDHLYLFLDYCDISRETICFISDKKEIASKVNVVTNSGFVRPINDDFISLLPKDAAISLMFESWEFRPEDIDLSSCIRNHVPILGVNENDRRLNIFRYVGLSVLKLLFEEEIEVLKGNFLLLSSGSYLREITHVLTTNGAEVDIIDIGYSEAGKGSVDITESYDAIIVAEQDNRDCLLCEKSAYLDMDTIRCDGPIIHVAGVVDDDYIANLGYRKYPNRKIDYGYMSVTTEYMGVRPVIELNAAGLKVGQMLVEGMRKYNDVRKAQEYALDESCVMDFDMSAAYKMVNVNEII